MQRVKHVSRSAERPVAAPRTETWAALLDSLTARADSEIVSGDPAWRGAGAERHVDVGDRRVRERALSVEPPWRLCLELHDTPLELCQLTFVIRDDGPTSNLAWAAVVEPNPSAEGWAFFDAVVAAVPEQLDEIGRRAETEVRDRHLADGC